MKKCKICGKDTDNWRKIKTKGKLYFSDRCRKCECERNKKWYQENKDKHIAYSKEYYLKNKQRISKRHNIIGKIWANKQTQKYGVPYQTTLKFGLKKTIAVYKKYNKKCAICNSKMVLCVHHKDGVGFGNYKKLNKPVNNLLENLLLVCQKCHMKIHDNFHNGKYGKLIK